MAAKSTTAKLTLKITSFILRLLMNIIFYILVVILIVNVSKKAFEFTYQLYGPVTVEQAPGRDVIFQIKQGESTMDVARKLEINRAIVNRYSFYLKSKLQNKVIMAGTYNINTSMTYDQILAVITDYTQSTVQVDQDGANKGTSGNTGQTSDQGAGGTTDQNAGDNGNQE